MRHDQDLRGIWFWNSSVEFWLELETLLGPSLVLTPQQKYEITELQERFLKNKARPRKDFKNMVGFKEFGLLELRFVLVFGAAQKRVRLLASNFEGKTWFLLWHLKNEALDLDAQRAEQNRACFVAVERMRGMIVDNSFCKR